MNTCVAAHAINGFGSDIMLILPNNDAYCDLCDLISATCKMRCSCIESHSEDVLYIGRLFFHVSEVLYTGLLSGQVSEVLYTGLLFVHVRSAVY